MVSNLFLYHDDYNNVNNIFYIRDGEKIKKYIIGITSVSAYKIKTNTFHKIICQLNVINHV